MLEEIIKKHGIAKTARACGVTTGAVQGWIKNGLPNAISETARKKRAGYEAAIAKLDAKTPGQLRKQLKESGKC